MSRSRGRSYMQLSTNQFIALAVAGKLTEFLETQFGNDLTAHKGNYTSTARRYEVFSRKFSVVSNNGWQPRSAPVCRSSRME